jgi:ribosome biogenesis GTPase
MSGRRLSQNQARRVNRLQQQRVSRALDSEGQDGALSRTGLVISRFGKQADIEDPAEPGTITRCHIRANIDSLVAGDRIAWRAEADGGVVLARQDRHSAIHRPDALGRMRAVAANLDRLVVVLATQPPPHANLLDRYLAAAEDAGIEAMVLLNKTDLPDGGPELRAMLAGYTRIGYEVLFASARQAGGMEALRAALAGHTTAFVGQSGVGKSSIIAALLPHEELRIGALSEAESKGRHTTTAARLYHLPQGGELIDSPGIREFSLAFLEPARLAAAFREFSPYLGRCRFSDCRHGEEPGCELRAAVATGAVSEPRYRSYLQILGDDA